MPRKEKINAKTWERDRRNRMNTYFKTLSDLLPPHQEGRKRNKVDILIHASKYIKELNNRTEELFNAHAGEVHKEELSRLKKLINQLFSRTQLLSTLLRDAGITVPAEPALEKISPLKWSNKLNVEDGEKYLDRMVECKKPEKRNVRNKQMGYKVPSKKKSVNLASSSPNKSPETRTSLNCDDGLIEDQENNVNSSITPSNESPDANSAVNSNALKLPDSSHDASSVETTAAKPSKGIRKLESRKKVKRKGKLIDSKIKKKKKNCVTSAESQSIANILPGTLIWSAGKLMPLVTPLTPNILVSAQTQPSNSIILSNPQQSQMIVMQPLTNRVQNSVLRNQAIMKAVQNVNPPNIHTSVNIDSRDWACNVRNTIEASKISGRKGILPKGKEITTTTMTYKVPIVAIHRQPVRKIHETTEQETKVKKKITKSRKIQQRDKVETEVNETSEKKSTNASVSTAETIVKTTKINGKRKNIDEPKTSDDVPAKIPKPAKLPVTCKTIDNLRHVVEKIGDDDNEEPKKQEAIIHSENNETSISSVSGSNETTNVTEIDAESTEKSIISQSEVKANSPEDSAKTSVNVNPVENSSEVEEKISDPLQTVDVSESAKIPPATNNEVSIETIAAEIVTENPVVKEKEVCDLETPFDSLLAVNETKRDVSAESIVDNAKIILNLDTNTTETMKPDIPAVEDSLNTENASILATAGQNQIEEVGKIVERSKDESLKSLSYSAANSFVPINTRAEGLHSDLSNDLFASLQVPSSSHNPESISPTAAFLMAFPLVSSLNGKTEVLEEEMKEDMKYHSQTPPMLLQIGAIEPNSFKVKTIDSTVSLQQSIADKSDNCRDKIIPKVSSESVAKALPKIVNSETIKDRLYKVVQFPESSCNTNNFPATSTNVRSNNDSNNVRANIVGPPMIGAAVSNVLESTSSKPDNNARKCEGQKYDANAIRGSIATSELPKYDSINRYPSNPDYLPGYTNFSGNANQSRTNFGMAKIGGNSTQVSTTISSVSNVNSTVNYPSMRSQAVQSAYVAHTTGKEPNSQLSQQIYANRSKESTNSTAESMAYGITYPSVSQHDYSTRPKDSYPVQSYDIHSKDAANVQTPFHGYPIVQSKNFSETNQNDRPYVTSHVTENLASNKETSQSTDNPIVPVSAVKTDHFAQNYGHFTSKDPKENVDTMFQSKRSETYAPFRDAKKTIFDATAQVSSKNQIAQNSLPRYQLQQQQQQQQNCVATSNYPQNSANVAKSTTTVAHNSNFSILSWTTFSPISGGGANNANNTSNNIVQYETSGENVEDIENKTICENYASYVPIHKDNISYVNMLPVDNFTQDSAISVDKTRSKLVHDSLKQIFDDKTKTVQSISQQKSTRPQNQTTNSEDYKFSSVDKSKNSKYPMNYGQTEFASLQQASKTHQSSSTTKPDKSNYTMPTYDPHANFDLPESSVQIKCNSDIYTASNYKYSDEKDLQLKYQPHVQSQAILHQNNNYNVQKHNQQQQQHQQQQSQQQIANKSKTIVHQHLQQQPIRAPVNWMMTPEIKHNTNIADLILPPIGKELEYCQNNIFTQPSYNQNSSNHQFYNNYEAVSGSHGFPNIPSLPSDPRRIADGFYPEDQQQQPFTWSPTKNSQSIEHNQSIKTMDQHVVVPSTLPTLVGDLALGTNISEKQSFLFGQMPPRANKELSQAVKDNNKEANVVASRDYQTMINPQSTFLSVSQLVEHEKAEKSHNQQHNNHNPHQHSTPQRKNQRKTNASPRGAGKRQIENRKQQNNVTEQQMITQHTDEQKITHHFGDYHQHSQQQQKYQQNDVHWRNRHCKSNYTAEALIGGSTSVHETNQDKLQTSSIKSFTTDYTQNKYPSGLTTTDIVMPPINYLSNTTDDPNSYGQVVNQNFNHSSYAYSPNTNIYPTTNFITSIANTPTSYMMPIHENPPDFLETNSFLLPNVSNVSTTTTTATKTTINTSSSSASATVSSSSTRNTTSTTSSVPVNTKNHQQLYSSNTGKHQNCDKRNSYATTSKKNKRKSEIHNLDFVLTTGVTAPIDDYHSTHHHHHHHHGHSTTFLTPPPHANSIYQNHPTTLSSNSNRATRGSNATVNTGPLTHHHPSGTSLTNFNLSTIFPEINDKVTGYKPPTNVVPTGLAQSTNHASATYPQRANYSNTIGHLPQVSESTQFTTDLPVPPPPGVLHYKTT